MLELQGINKLMDKKSQVSANIHSGGLNHYLPAINKRISNKDFFGDNQ